MFKKSVTEHRWAKVREKYDEYIKNKSQTKSQMRIRRKTRMRKKRCHVYTVSLSAHARAQPDGRDRRRTALRGAAAPRLLLQRTL